MLFFGSKQEIIQELRNTQFLSVAQVYIFGNILYDIDHLHLFVKLQAILTVIAETNSFAHIEASAIRFHFPHQHFNKGRLPGTIVTDNTHLLETGKNIIEIFYDFNIAKAFRHMLRFKYLRSDIGSFHIQIHISVIPLLLGFLLQFIKSIDTIFSLRSTGLRLTAHPFQFLT